MNWRVYPRYINAGVEWLDQIPASWRMQKLRRISPLTTGWTPPSGDDASYSGDNPWANISDLGPRVLQAPARSISDDAVRSSRIPVSPRGSLLFSFKLSVGQVSFAGADMYTNEAIATFRESEQLDLGFAYYSFPLTLIKNANENIYGAKLLNQELMYAARIPLPPVDEQRSIASFLDRETAKIDVLIGKQEQLVAALQEQRSTTADLVLDSHGFTAPRSLADLDSATPPKGWQIIRLGTVLRQLTNGFVGPTRDILVDQGVPYIQSTHIKQGRIDFNRRPFYVRREWHDERPRIHLREGDVLIVQTGDIGKVAVVPPGFGEASCHALQIARVKPEKLTGKYLGVFLSSRIGYHYLCSLATGALHPHLEAGIRKVPIVVPPLALQTIIVRQVHEQIAKIDVLIEKATEVIETLGEYRTALITEAVTGKIDVRAAV